MTAAFFAKGKMPSLDELRKQRFELMVHGKLSYLDWAAMNHWQKQDFIIRLNMLNEEKKREQEKQEAHMRGKMHTSTPHHPRRR